MPASRVKITMFHVQGTIQFPGSVLIRLHSVVREIRAIAFSFFHGQKVTLDQSPVSTMLTGKATN